jgi:hypothetical protein
MKWTEFKNRKLSYLTKIQYGFFAMSLWCLAVMPWWPIQGLWAVVSAISCYNAISQTIVDLVID